MGDMDRRQFLGKLCQKIASALLAIEAGEAVVNIATRAIRNKRLTEHAMLRHYLEVNSNYIISGAKPNQDYVLARLKKTDDPQVHEISLTYFISSEGVIKNLRVYRKSGEIVTCRKITSQRK